MKNNNYLKTENFWTSIVWLVVFVIVLSWDQEKIVVLCLVLFCYFIYFYVGNDIEVALQQRQVALAGSLLSDINAQLDSLKNLLASTKSYLNSNSNILLYITKKFFIVASGLCLKLADDKKLLSISYKYTQLALQNTAENINSKNAQYNLASIHLAGAGANEILALSNNEINQIND